MMVHLRFIRFLFTLLMLMSVLSIPAHAQSMNTPNEEKNVHIQLLAENTKIGAGETVYLAIEQDIKEGWHTYWENPGDSGAPIQLDWTVPEGFELGDLKWPVPDRIPFGPLMNFGYEGKAVLFQTFTAPLDLPEGPITLTSEYEILVCADICIPEFGTLSVTFNEGEATANAEYVAEHHKNIPFELPWVAFFKEEAGNLVIDITVQQRDFIAGPGDVIEFELYPIEWGYIDNPSDLNATFTPPRNLRLEIARGDRALETSGPLDFVLGYFKRGTDDKLALRLLAKPDPVWLKNPQATTSKPLEQKTESEVSAANEHLQNASLLQIMLYALLGGLILNLMPCVFPVLSMKALHISKTAHEGWGKTAIHGLTYTLGILVSFTFLGGLLIALQSAGAQIGWGFQLQNPMIITALVFLFFLVGLNLSGFFEIHTKAANIGSSLAEKKGATGSFFTGILATIVATPCTAPFMGAAIGFALTQPAQIGLIVFLSLGLGLALPFLILTIIPGLSRIIPKPGTWMVTFKELLAFPIYLTVVWLLWVMMQQTGMVSVTIVMFALVGVAFGIWLHMKGVTKAVVLLVILASIATPIYQQISPDLSDMTPDLMIENTSVETKDFSKIDIDELLATDDRAILVNMTAAWCITCKFNERVALKTDKVQSLMTKNDVVYVKGDWTNYDEKITKYLSRYGRKGVPLYVFYGAKDAESGQRPEAVILPQLLTPGIVIETLKN